MRYRGRGVGHLATRQCNQILLADKHTLRDDISDGDEDLEPLVGPEGEEDGQPEGGGRGDGEEDGQEDVQEDSDEDGDDVLRYCRNVRPTWVKFDSKDTKESDVVFEVLSTNSKKRN